MTKIGRPTKLIGEHKTCKKCRKKKHIDEYYATSSYCKPCHRHSVKKNQKQKKRYYNKYRSEYEAKNADRKKDWKKNWMSRWEAKHGVEYKEHRRLKRLERLKNSPRLTEQLKLQRKEYVENNKEKIKQDKRSYYIKHRERLIEEAKQNYQNNKEQRIVSAKIRRAKASIKKAIESCSSKKLEVLVKRLSDLFQQQQTIITDKQSI